VYEKVSDLDQLILVIGILLILTPAPFLPLTRSKKIDE